MKCRVEICVYLSPPLVRIVVASFQSYNRRTAKRGWHIIKAQYVLETKCPFFVAADTTVHTVLFTADGNDINGTIPEEICLLTELGEISRAQNSGG